VRKPPIRKLTIYLLREGVARDEAFREEATFDDHLVPVLRADVPSLFTSSKPPREPSWVGYVGQHVAEPITGLLVASAGAVLLLEAANRLLAIAWGQGRHLLDATKIQPEFGLRCVLNGVEPSQLKSVDAKTIDETTVHTRRDVSRDSDLATFGLDVAQDLLRGVTGTPRDKTLGERLTGADPLGITTAATLPQLPALCERLLDVYAADTYKERFDFIDHLRLEKDKGRIEKLNDRLITALSAHELTDVHLAAPEPLDWLDLAGFRFKSRKRDRPELLQDPRITTYLDQLREDPTVDGLKRDRMYAFSLQSDDVMNSWPIYQCIVYQEQDDDSLYVLSTGDWYCVDNEYRRQVETEVRAIAKFEDLPAARPGTSESDYNVAAASALDGACMDKQLVRADGLEGMELCDVLLKDLTLIHVKHRGASSTLSHLFAQGTNSTERLLLDPGFRREAREAVKSIRRDFATVVPLHRPDSRQCTVVFAVITRSTRATPLTLPFFSVVGLRAAARILDGFGVDVKVAEVHEE
jgi:uncharacterized protein (TIGR04141 family)